MARRAKATAKLLEQVNELAPARNKSSDGWIGDAAHAASKSDHNANSAGAVQAQDITHDPADGLDSYKLAEALRKNKDARVKYVISNRKIFAGNDGPSPWDWRSYSGKNPHDQHVHVSVEDKASLYDDDTAWNLEGFSAIADPSAPRKTLPVLRKGSKGFYVEMLQTCLGGTTADGDFGAMTDQAVRQFQRDKQLDDDGVVGPYTWRELFRPWAKEVKMLPEDPQAKLIAMAEVSRNLGATATVEQLVAAYLVILEEILPPGYGQEPPPKPPTPTKPWFSEETIEEIETIAMNSAIMNYQWADRGKAPPGYIKGMAVAFATVLAKWSKNDSSAIEMAKANTHDPDKDALEWYASEFNKLGMSNASDGIDTLRHLFVLLMGLGMRESSGRHCCGVDVSAGASSQTSDTAEAGAWQMSWNASNASAEMDRIMDYYRDKPPACAIDIFSEGVTCTTKEWACIGTGEGYTYQQLAKSCPAFAAECTAIALRVLRKHFGPINRKEAELRPEADDMLEEVQRLVITKIGEQREVA